MKKKKSKHKIRQARMRHAARAKQASINHEPEKQEDFSTAGVTIRAFMFWFSAIGVVITLIGNYDHFLLATSWMKYFVSNWIIVLDNFWSWFWRLIGLDAPTWLKIISSNVVFLSFYLSGVGIPKKEKKHYDPDQDFLNIGIGSETKFQRRVSQYYSDLMIYTGLKYIFVGLTVHPEIKTLSLTGMTFTMMTVMLIMVIMISPYWKWYYRRKLAARMLFILLGAAMIFALSYVPFMQFDPANIPGSAS